MTSVCSQCEFLSIFVVFILFGSELTLFCLDLSLSFAESRVYFAVSFVVVPCVRLVLPCLCLLCREFLCCGISSLIFLAAF